MTKTRPSKTATIPAHPKDGHGSNALEIYFEQFGPLMGGRNLWTALGYPSQGAFAQARRRGRIPVELISLPGRRGAFAYTNVVFAWLTSLGVPPEPPAEKEP